MLIICHKYKKVKEIKQKNLISLFKIINLIEKYGQLKYFQQVSALIFSFLGPS